MLIGYWYTVVVAAAVLPADGVATAATEVATAAEPTAEEPQQQKQQQQQRCLNYGGQTKQKQFVTAQGRQTTTTWNAAADASRNQPTRPSKQEVTKIIWLP